MKNNHDIHLVKTIADMAVFFELSDDSIIDPDVALQAMEQMAAELQLMDEAAKESFCSQLRIVALQYSEQQIDVINGLAESFGIA